MMENANVINQWCNVSVGERNKCIIDMIVVLVVLLKEKITVADIDALKKHAINFVQ